MSDFSDRISKMIPNSTELKSRVAECIEGELSKMAKSSYHRILSDIENKARTANYTITDGHKKISGELFLCESFRFEFPEGLIHHIKENSSCLPAYCHLCAVDICEIDLVSWDYLSGAYETPAAQKVVDIIGDLAENEGIDVKFFFCKKKGKRAIPFFREEVLEKGKIKMVYSFIVK